MIDERKEEAAALYALDLLEGAELSAFEAELAADRELRHLVDRLRETSAGVALLAPPAAPSAFLRERIMAAAADRSTTRPDHVVPFILPAWAGWAAAACFIIATGYFVVANFNTRSQFDSLRENARLSAIEIKNLNNILEAERLISKQQIASLKGAQTDIADLRAKLATERAEASAQIADLLHQNALADLKIASLASLAGNSPQAQAIAVWNPKTQEGVLSVAKLPALASDKDYQLWVIDPAYPNPVDGGVFQVDPATGDARVNFKPNKDVKFAAKFAVSLERKGGVPKAQGPIVLLSD
ncbi:MAG TPA: anti-sigma factor [Rariglobus sp.]|jgi:anti-sigma-K factor RskA|nr:anti-sigma factor [Rariglobus sp.]